MAGALDGVRIVDLSWGMAGPMATGQLADHGASVTRVEPPGGDPYRPFASHAAYDRGKRSVVLDLRTGDGIEVVHRLLADADVLVESWRPGVAERFGLDHRSLHDRYPRLVTCSISGYGADAADRERPGYDSLVCARLGAMGEQWEPGGAPVYLAVPIASVGAALLAVIGITAALLEREDTGRGQHVDTSLVDGALGFLSMFWEQLEHDDARADLRSAPDGGPSRYRLLVKTYRCADGEYLGIHTGAGGSHARLIEALGLADRVAPAPPGIQEKKVPLSPEEAVVVAEEIPRVFATRPRSDWLRLLRARDVTAIPLLRQTEAFLEEQVRHNGVVVEVDDPELGPLQQVGVAARLGATPGEVRSPAPRPGQHTREVLAELGYEPDRIAAIAGAAQ